MINLNLTRGGAPRSVGVFTHDRTQGAQFLPPRTCISTSDCAAMSLRWRVVKAALRPKQFGVPGASLPSHVRRAAVWAAIGGLCSTAVVTPTSAPTMNDASHHRLVHKTPSDIETSGEQLGFFHQSQCAVNSRKQSCVYSIFYHIPACWQLVVTPRHRMGRPACPSKATSR